MANQITLIVSVLDNDDDREADSAETIMNRCIVQLQANYRVLNCKIQMREVVEVPQGFLSPVSN